MKSFQFINLLLVILSSCYLSKVSPQEQRADTIVAIVNDEIITYGEVVEKVKEILQGIENSGLSRREKDMRKQWHLRNKLKEMVDEKLTLQEAKRYNIKISEDTIREQLEKELKQRGKTFDAGEVDLMDLMRSKLTVQELLHRKASYSKDEKQRAAIDTFVAPWEINYAYKKNIKDFTKERKIKTRIITLFYSKYGGRDKTIEKARALVTELREGADFTAIAKEYSNDAYAKEGGTWPRIEKGDEAVWDFFSRKEALFEEADDIAFAMNKGEISDPIPVDSQSYCQIIKIDDVKSGETVSFREAQEIIVPRLRFEKVILAMDRMKSRLRQRASIWPPDLFK